MTQYPTRLEFVALGTDPDAARSIAADTGGIVYVANGSTHPRAPFRSLLRTVVSDVAELAPAADVATHLVCSRQIKSHPVSWAPGEPTPGVVAAFGLRHHPAMTHAETDRHWHHVHAPLALEHHQAMWDYVQLSVVETLAGPELDGIALCSFPTLEDHNERFFNDAESRRVISDDVATFADIARSPRPALLSEILPG